jgi:hypothetical protein
VVSRLDPTLADHIKACKKAGLPLCLTHSIECIFGQKDVMMNLAKSGGFEIHPVTNVSDLYENYVDFICALERVLGNDAVAVLESRIIKEIEALKGTDCPIYELELKRKEQKYKDSIAIPARARVRS